MLSERQSRDLIVRNIAVSRLDVVLAKDYVMKHLNVETQKVVSEFLEAYDAVPPEIVVLHEAANPEDALDRAARSIAMRLACLEGILELIHSGLILPASESIVGEIPGIRWTTVYQNSGGSSSGWRFPDVLTPCVPRLLMRAPSKVHASQALFDSDLFLKELAIPGLHTEVEFALRDAVQCLRTALLTPCVAMLGKAAEGAWVELGLALVGAIPVQCQSMVDKAKEELASPYTSIAKKILTVLSLYDRQDIFRPVRDRSGVDHRRLREAALWADVVRDSRNVVHYGVEPSVSNTYDKIAMLLLGAVSHLQMVYRVINASSEVGATGAGNS